MEKDVHIMDLSSKNVLASQLNELKRVSTNNEWLIFVLAYYEELNMAEIQEVMNMDHKTCDKILDNVLIKACAILGENIKYLTKK